MALNKGQSDIEQRIAGVLAAHEFWAGVGMCSCKYDCEPFNDEYDGEERAHRAHVSAVIAATCAPHIAADVAAQALQGCPHCGSTAGVLLPHEDAQDCELDAAQYRQEAPNE